MGWGSSKQKQTLTHGRHAAPAEDMDTLNPQLEYQDRRGQKWSICGGCRQQVFTLAHFNLCQQCHQAMLTAQQEAIDGLDEAEVAQDLRGKLRKIQERYPGLVAKGTLHRLRQLGG